MATKNAPSYALTEKQVEQLALETYEAAGRLASNNHTYLRVLVTACQAQLGAPSRRRAVALDAQVSVLESAHTKYYAAVLRGVTTADITVDDVTPADVVTAHSRERSRRATFARSAASTLRAFVNSGGDIRAIDVPTVTKASLRAEVNAGRDVAQLETRAFERAQGAMLRVFTARAREHPDEARAMLDGAIEVLQAALDELGAEPQPEATATGTRVGRIMAGSRVMPTAPMLHRGAL